MTPEIQGALSLAAHHEQAAGAIHFRSNRRLRKKHQSKAQKLRRRAEVLAARGCNPKHCSTEILTDDENRTV